MPLHYDLNMTPNLNPLRAVSGYVTQLHPDTILVPHSKVELFFAKKAIFT